MNVKLPFFKREKRKAYLEYSTIRSWRQCENVPLNFVVEYGSGRRPDYEVYMDQFCELRQHLFEKHLQTLPKETQSQFKRREHPSQSHSKAELALPVLEKLRNLLEDYDFVEGIEIKCAQMDLVQFNVILNRDATITELEPVPEYIDGYVINLLPLSDKDFTG
jgi:hypothetical protein